MNGFRLVAATVAMAAMLPATAYAQTLTPAGPATLDVRFGPNVGCPAVGTFAVLTKWQVQVGPGSSGGIVRPLFYDVVGDPVELPAEPGTYTFPAPHMNWSPCNPGISLIQETGGHAVVVPEDTPMLGRHIVVKRDGQAEERIDQSRLAIEPVTEPDNDSDLLGDLTEDRTDLTLTAAPTRDAIGRLKVTVTVTNAGPLPANRQHLTATGAQKGRWDTNCRNAHATTECLLLEPLAVGASRTITFYDDAPGTLSAGFSVTAEGPDLNVLNNSTGFIFGSAPAFDVTTAAKQRLKNGIQLSVLSAAQQTARVTVAIKLRGKTVKLSRTVRLAGLQQRAITIRPAGANLRRLRSAPAKKSLPAQITVSTADGKSPVTVKTTLTQ